MHHITQLMHGPTCVQHLQQHVEAYETRCGIVYAATLPSKVWTASRAAYGQQIPAAYGQHIYIYAPTFPAISGRQIEETC